MFSGYCKFRCRENSTIHPAISYQLNFLFAIQKSDIYFMNKHILVLIFTTFILCQTDAQAITSFNAYLRNSNQVLFVKTKSADAIQGTMYLYERKNSRKRWRRFDSFAIVVGRAGLAKDSQTTLSVNGLPLKKEGDGKSPAGIFPLGDVFSYHKLDNLKMPFVQVDTNFYCVDDASSSYYNTLVVNDTAKQSFNSFEYMKRKDDLYEYGIWVLYNSSPVVSGNGSCIFIHVWKDSNSGTSGCTAMAKENIVKLIHWLDKKKNPVLLQIVSE